MPDSPDGPDRPDRPDSDDLEPVLVSQGVYRRLEVLARDEQKTVRDLVEQAVELQFGDSAVEARRRLIDRLARLEGRLGDPDELHEQIRVESRRVRSRA